MSNAQSLADIEDVPIDPLASHSLPIEAVDALLYCFYHMECVRGGVTMPKLYLKRIEYVLIPTFGENSASIPFFSVGFNEETSQQQ